MKNIGRLFGLIIILFLCNQGSVYGQENKPKNYSCTQIMKLIGYHWKQDSSGTNGLRRFTAQKFLDCRIDTITKEDLLVHLGSPNRIWKQQFGEGEFYVYHTFDISKMPKDFDGPLSCSYICFLFSPLTGYLLSISEGDIDM